MATGIDGLNLNRLVVFVAVVESGSITKAASRLGLGKTVISTHIQQLERELGVTLLVRNTRRLDLTESGEQFFCSAQTILQDARDAIERISQNTGRPHGILRLSAPVDYTTYILMPVLVKLQQAYPELTISLTNDDRCVDLIGEKVDVAIRLSELADSNLQAVRVSSFNLWLVAHPSFLSTRDNLSHPSQLERLPFISLSVLNNPVNWNFSNSNEKQRVQFCSCFSVNTAHMAKVAALIGGGITIVPDFAAAEDVRAGRLVRVLPDWSIASKGIYVVFPYSRFIPVKIRVLIDALKVVSTEIDGKDEVRNEVGLEFS